MRKLVLGDQHGALKAVKQVLERCEFDYENDLLINLGDVVDGWSETAELVEFWINFKKKCKYPPIFIIGNHDVWVKDYLEFGKTPIIWTEQGGKASMNSYIKTGYLVKDSHRAFFRNMLDYYIDDDNNGFVHGGFSSRKGLGREKHKPNYYWDRDLWSLALLSHGRFHEVPNLVKDGMEHSRRFERHKEVFVGHTSTVNWNDDKGNPITEPMNRCNVWNMDTGAGFKGKLTIMDINTKEFWQSDFVQELYPDELGRG